MGNALRFPRRQCRRLFLPSLSLADPTIKQNRFAGSQIEFPNDGVAVVNQDTLIEGDDLHLLPTERTAEMPLPAV